MPKMVEVLKGALKRDKRLTTQEENNKEAGDEGFVETNQLGQVKIASYPYSYRKSNSQPQRATII